MSAANPSTIEQKQITDSSFPAILKEFTKESKMLTMLIMEYYTDQSSSATTKPLDISDHINTACVEKPYDFIMITKNFLSWMGVMAGDYIKISSYSEVRDDRVQEYEQIISSKYGNFTYPVYTDLRYQIYNITLNVCRMINGKIKNIFNILDNVEIHGGRKLSKMNKGEIYEISDITRKSVLRLELSRVK